MDISGCLKMAVLSCWSASLWDSIPLHQPLCPHPLLVSPPTSPRQLLLHWCLAAGTMVAGGGGGAWTSRGGSKPLTPCLSFLSWVQIGPLTVWGRFTTSGFNISAIMGEVLQEHLCLPLVLVQDPSFIPSSVTTFILLIFQQLSFICLQPIHDWRRIRELTCVSLWVFWPRDLTVSFQHNKISYSLLSKQNGIRGDHHNSAQM